jgi:hypothetical protein
MVTRLAAASEVLVLGGVFKGLVCVFAIGGGALIFTSHRIPLMDTDFSQFPGGAMMTGTLLVLLGLWLALQPE